MNNPILGLQNFQDNFYDFQTVDQNIYNSLKSKESFLLCDINKHNQPARLLRNNKEYFYKPDFDKDIIVGDKKTIAKEISNRYYNMDIEIVDNFTDILHKQNFNINDNIAYLSNSAIPFISENIFEPNIQYEIYLNPYGYFTKNDYKHSQYSLNKFCKFNLDHKKESFAKQFMKKMTTFKDNIFLANRLSEFFCHLNTSNTIVLVGNKDVSELILVNKILKPLFGSQYCVTITEELLENMTMEDIIKHKLIYHIGHIPKSKSNREKLREILLTILINKCIMVDNKNIPIYGQVIFTIEEADHFLKDFLSSSDVFFVDSIQNIMTNLHEKDHISLHKKLFESLDLFSKELLSLGNTLNNFSQSNSQRQEFQALLNTIDEEVTTQTKSNLLDPFSENFEKLIPIIERYKHTYITGQTGSGKSELLKTLILRDILRANGSVILLEPHGDLSEQVVKMVQDKKRLVYINPFLSENKTPTINLFHLENKSETNIARVTQIILNVLKSVNSDESFSGSMEDHLEMGIRVLLRRSNCSFKDLYRLYNDARNYDLVEYGKNSPNQLESEFFNDDFESSKPTKDAVRRRLKKLLNDPIFSNLMNGKNTIDLEKEINNEDKVIIFNIPKGKMTNTYKYYMRFIVEYIQVLALKRADISEEERTDSHLYIDEAHNFISSTATISEILAESRKYKLFITFAHQAITQIKDTNLRDILTTMTNVKIIGKNSNKTLEAMNKTLNTKLEDVETLKSGEFYLSAGSNEIIKINNTDKLLDGKEEMSNNQWQEHRQYQLANYYRSTKEFNFDEATDEFVEKLLSKIIDLRYFEQLQNYPEKYAEFLYNLVEDKNGRFIAQPEMSFYFNIMYPEAHVNDNKLFLSDLRSRYEVFKQKTKDHKKYNDKFRYKLL